MGDGGGKKHKAYRLNIDKIIESLSEVQAHWPEISSQLSMQCEYPTDEIIQNMALAYRYLDHLVSSDIKVFSNEGVLHLLELNHIVLCGSDPKLRKEFHAHIERTRNHFFQHITPIKRWYKENKKSPTIKLAAQIYVCILSRPQLFLEGNHRTGGLIASFFLLKGQEYPFVLSYENAAAYFEPSTLIKFEDKHSIKGLWNLPKYKKKFEKFLKDRQNPRFVL